MSRSQKLQKLETRIGYSFSDRSLLENALTHGSYGDGRRKIDDYQRLEFLGDRVLGLFTAEILYRKSDENEGGLARKLNALVRKETCAEISQELDLGDMILMSKAAVKQGGRTKVSILGDAAESLLGAIFLDGGFEAAKIFYQQFWHERVLNVLDQAMKDPKTELQERAAAQKINPPVYTLAGQTGPDHRPHFQIEVTVGTQETGRGEGLSKKDAERAAAADLLEKWKLP